MGLGAHDIRSQEGRGDKPRQMSTSKLIYPSNKICIGHQYVPDTVLDTGGIAVNKAG